MFKKTDESNTISFQLFSINLIVKSFNAKKPTMRQQQTSSPTEQQQASSKQQSTNGSVAGENDDLADLNDSLVEIKYHQNQSTAVIPMLKHVNVVVQYQLNHIKKKMQHLMLKPLYQKIMQQCKH